MEYPKFSVLMSLYLKEKPEYLNEALKSVINQTVKPNEIVIIYDGPITTELKNVVKQYVSNNPGLIKIIDNPDNKGLGLALADGVPQCTYELIARMDTDDICREDRFEIKLQEFMIDSSLDICGSHIKEFDQDIHHTISQRKVPLTNDGIIQYQETRSAYNHMTVMFKKSSVLKAGNYEHAPLMEDDMLWTRMILAKCKGKNIDDYLVYARTGLDMIERRGGWSYFKKYRASRKKVYKLGLVSRWDYLYTIIVQFFVSLIPKKARKMIFLKFLRKSYELR